MSWNVWLATGVIAALIAAMLGRAAVEVLGRRRMLLRLLRARTGGSESGLVQELWRSGLEPRIAEALQREIRDIVSLHDGIEQFPVRADDDLRELYRFTTWIYAGFPDDPDLWGLAHDVAGAAERRFSYDHNAVTAELEPVRTVRQLAAWVQSLPPRILAEQSAAPHTSSQSKHDGDR